MRFLFVLFVLFFNGTCLFSQSKMDKTLKRFNNESVPYVHSENITDTETVVFLDTRKKEEYAVSHLRNSIWVGDKEFDPNVVLEQVPDKQKPIIVYCSIGVRSEDIGEKLLTLGYTNVQNLYGGIFQWKNNNGLVYNLKNQPTDSVHAFNKYWGKLLLKGVKVY